eukprot:XP_011603256.1 PREDICTED: coiled-coil domain-containing protein 80-like [Takifugu rubripes]
MFRFALLLLAAACSSGFDPSRSQGAHKKDLLDPNVRDWGDYSDLIQVEPRGSAEEEGGAGEPSSSLAPELDFLAEFAGKRRLWVITAPSHNSPYLRMMEKQLEELDQRALNCRLAERDTFIITVIQNAMMEGRIQKTTPAGEATVESLDPDMVTKLLHYLDLSGSERDFTMLVVKKNLRTSERFPYPVRVEAVLELIDQFPMRKLEKMTRKGKHQSCRGAKKKVVLRRTMKRRVVPSPRRTGNTTSAGPQTQPAPDKKAALKRRIQDILNGRSRFVIRKVPAAGSSRSGGRTPSAGQGGAAPSPPSTTKEEKKDSLESTAEEDQRRPAGTDDGGTNPKKNQRSGKKKKGGKGKKGKRKGSEASEKDRAALKQLLDGLKGTRRLMVISTPSGDASLYTQQREENEKHLCQLAARKITVATLVGRAALTLRHHQLEGEPALSGQSEHASEPGLISLLRAELGLSSSDLFSMTVTDYDMKPGRVFEAPPAAPALFQHIDSFPSRRSEKEKEKERKSPPPCSQRPPQPGADNSLLRFTSRRRLLLLSAPSEEDHSFQQQLSALGGQECPLGVRHFAALQMTGVGDRAKGSVQLFPLNGHSQTETEPLSPEDIKHMRQQLQINKDYFSLLFVEKDGEVKAWFPSPVWSLDNIYDLVDSSETRLQEEKLQGRLGIRCPDGRGMRTDYGFR